MKLQPNEIELKGNWVQKDSKIVTDIACDRIEELIYNYLIKVARDDSGWNILYQDPDDKRYWELSYPQGERHGGGPPLLKNISEQEAKRLYMF